MKFKDLEELEEIIVKAKALGLSYFECDGLKFQFANKGDSKPVSELNRLVPDVKAEDLIKSAPHLDDLTSEEILYYATPYFDEIQAEKEHKTQLAEDSL